jgi:hypothetical protein
MSRLMADHESRGRTSGDSDAVEEDSVMRVNLSEGGRAVNDETCRMLIQSAGEAVHDTQPHRHSKETSTVFFMICLVRKVVLIGCFSV